MTVEDYRPGALDSDRLVDAHGRPVGRLLASRYGDDRAPEALVVRLADEVREAHLVRDETVEVSVGRVKVANGKPRLTITLDELLDETGVSHADRPDHAKRPEERPPHFGAPAYPRAAPDGEPGRHTR